MRVGNEVRQCRHGEQRVGDGDGGIVRIGHHRGRYRRVIERGIDERTQHGESSARTANWIAGCDSRVHRRLKRRARPQVHVGGLIATRNEDHLRFGNGVPHHITVRTRRRRDHDARHRVRTEPDQIAVVAIASARAQDHDVTVLECTARTALREKPLHGVVTVRPSAGEQHAARGCCLRVDRAAGEVRGVTEIGFRHRG